MRRITIAFTALLLALAQESRGDAPPQTATSSSLVTSAVPLIVGGTPSGSPPDSPALHVDPNSTSSPFAGVGSVFIDAAPIGDGFGFLCSSCAVHGFTIGKQQVRDYVLMAAHCLDFAGGLDPNSVSTGDGIADVAPQQVTFVLNSGSSLSSLIGVSEIHLHPNWHGFLNVGAPEGISLNDDVALLRLSTPVPAGVPTYNLATSVSPFVERLDLAGYGQSGTPAGFTVGASFSVKRTGHNQADRVYFDDELTSAFEVYEADFDGPDGSTNQIDLGLPGFDPGVEGTLGNNIESTLGGGDSGGPGFLANSGTGSLQLGSDGRPIVYSVNTFGSSNSPAYGSTLGGMLVGRYAGWINSIIVPEPTSLVLAVFGLLPGGLGGVSAAKRLSCASWPNPPQNPAFSLRLDYLAKPSGYPEAPIIAVTGDDAYLKSSVLVALRRQVLGGDEGEFSLTTLTGRDANFAT